MTRPATRKANAARKATTSAVAGTGAKRGRKPTTDRLVRFTTSQLDNLHAILAAFVAQDAPVAPVAPDVAAITAANTDADGNVNSDAINAAIAKAFAYAANYSALVAEHEARNAGAFSIIGAINESRPVSRN